MIAALACFVTQTVGTWYDIMNSRILFVGDSTAKSIKDHIIKRGLMLKNHVDIKHPYIQFAANESILPGQTNSTEVFDRADEYRYYNSSARRRHVNAVFLNFGTLHLLHLHPIRKWTHIDGQIDAWIGPSLGASFKGFYNLKQWVIRDLEYLSGVPYIDVVIIMTPNNVCINKFTGQYALWFKDAQKNLNLCAQYVRNESATDNSDQLTPAAFFSRPPSSISEKDSADLCDKGIFSSNATKLIADMMRAVASSLRFPKVRVLDATNITQIAGCAHTNDGRHYDIEVVDLQADRLSEIIAEFVKK